MLFERFATTTKAVDVKKVVDEFFKDNNLSWDMVSAVCSNGAPAMLGQKSGFGALVKADAPHIIVIHCILHKHAWQQKLSSKTGESIASCCEMCETVL